ncbi:MAG: acetyl/propionyl/methylcrotonyl-CoA carboxylase subunit alpha [Pseudomonadota bacterium]
MFDKILIANRGEIACRVVRTARQMGIRTVAVYSDADRDAQHVALADEAVCIGPAPSRESYLVVDKILQAARDMGAQAIHPGYGFLSENAEFARRVEEEAGLVFIGPKHAAIAAMGDKIASKKLALAAGVRTIPGHNESIATPDEAAAIAAGIGYPVMVKASAGGGGKGLRVAANEAELRTAYTACRNEARQSFGDDRVFIEKFVSSPRHIEIQVLADAHGHTVFLWERECSLQRRHQKVIEEAPSPFLQEATRQAMGAQAVALARAVNYQSAGTVEFVVGPEQDFYFLEMNTRLQVEHPVTECITGIDLVEQMIRIAAGEPLAFTQAEIPRRGWAMECRINAEDPARNFLPSTGRLVRYEPPPMVPGVRVDTGVAEGGEISVHYDAMIAKLITFGADRGEAMAKMRAALDAFVIRGIRCNLGFQSALLHHPDFIAGHFHTGFIAEHFPRGHVGADATPARPEFLLAVAAALHRRLLERATGIGGQLPGHEFQIGTDFVVLTVRPAEAPCATPVSVEADGPLIRVSVNGRVHVLCLHGSLRQIAVHGDFDGEPFCVQVERMGLNFRLTHQGVVVDTRVLSPRAAALMQWMPVKQPPDLSRLLLSPMPGLLAEVAVRPGQAVQAGDKLAIIEAMKMENLLLAESDVVIDEVLAQQGDSVAVDQPILRFK